MADRAWVIVYTSIDPSEVEGSAVVFLDEKKAVRDGAEAARDLANDELETLAFEEGSEEKKTLKQILKDYMKGDWRGAVEGWLEYAGDANPSKSFEIVEATLVR